MKLKTFIWAFGILAVIICTFLLLRNCNRSKPDIIAAVDSVQYYKNKLGQEVAAIKQREQDYYKAAEGYLDSIAKLHNTKSKLIQEIAVLTQRGTVKITTPGKPTIVYKDTGSTVLVALPQMDYVEQAFENKWYKALVHIPLDANSDTSFLQLETFDELRYVAKEVKEGGLFNRRTYLQVDAINTNPYNKIDGLSVYRKPLPKPKKIGIGIQGGYGFSTSFKASPYVGIGIHYSIIRL